MALASQVAFVDITRRRKIIGVNISPTGNYVTGGDTLDLTATTNPSYLQGGQFGTVPVNWEMANDPDGYSVVFIPGATLALCKLQYLSAGGVELAAAAYPALLIAAFTNINFSMRMWAF